MVFVQIILIVGLKVIPLSKDQNNKSNKFPYRTILLIKMQKKALTGIIFEFISIVFAVLLALGLNSYKQSLDLEKESQRIKDNILAEFQSNLHKIDTILLNNEQYGKYLDSLVRLPRNDVQGFYFEYSFELLTHSAYDVAQNSSSSNLIDNEFMLEAADIYHLQTFLEDFSLRVFENIGVALTKKDELKDGNLALSMYYNHNVMKTTTLSLKEAYQEFLDKYE